MTYRSLTDRNNSRYILRKNRKENGLCIECGKPSAGRLCEKHLILARKSARKIKAKRLSNFLKYGTCIKCNQLAINGTQLCEKHLLYYRARVAKKYKREQQYRIEHRLCSRCRVPLEDGEGRTCMNCSNPKLRRDTAYATNTIRAAA